MDDAGEWRIELGVSAQEALKAHPLTLSAGLTVKIKAERL